ncbi:MAG: hypothetical protein HOW73_11535 [Polyangiaceae bacterium]|nr:hypothetical protein [Polyangiaceae bacterium]
MVALPRLAHAAPPVDMDGLGRGRYARLHVKLEKTIFDVDVAALEIRVDQATADALQRAVKGREYSKKLETEVVSAVLGAENAYSALQFLRGFARDAFIKGIRTDLGRAYQAKLIDKSEYQRVYRGLPGWFGFLGDRGVKKGDNLYHRGKPEGLRSVYIDNEGQKRMDVTMPGHPPTRTLLASYLAPEGDLREPLVRSLFD